MPAAEFNVEEINVYRQGLLSALEVVVGKLSESAGRIRPERWHTPDQPGAYSPHYILTRLLVLEEKVYAIYVQHYLDGEAHSLPLFDEVTWLATHYDPLKAPSTLLDEFAGMRRRVIRRLQGLSSAEWSRHNRHPWYGVRTLQWWVEHQLESSHHHLRELEIQLAQ